MQWPTLYAVFVDGHFWKAYEHRVTAELVARGFRDRGKVVSYGTQRKGSDGLRSTDGVNLGRAM